MSGYRTGCLRQVGRLLRGDVDVAMSQPSLFAPRPELKGSRHMCVFVPRQQEHRLTDVCWPPGLRRCYCVSMGSVCKIFARGAARAVGCSERETGWRLCHDEPEEVMALRVRKSPRIQRIRTACNFGQWSMLYSRGSSIESDGPSDRLDYVRRSKGSRI